MVPLLIHEVGHIAAFALILYLGKRSLIHKPSLKLLLFGLLITLSIDLDHIIDFVAVNGFRFSPSIILSGSYFYVSSRVIVALHAWELVLLALVGKAYAKGKGKHRLHDFISILVLALLAHLSFDIVYYRFNPLVYFISYRALNRFSLSIFQAIY